MIALLGASGYVGSRFTRHMQDREIDFVTISRSTTDIYDSSALAAKLERSHVRFVINCAGYTGKPNVDACETNRLECFLANAVLPHIVAKACAANSIPFGHISSGCIYQGRPDRDGGFREDDEPNFSFRRGDCSFYSGTKALGEEGLSRYGRCYIWRLRIPFDEVPHPRNYLQKLLSYEQLLEAENSLTHLGEFVEACLDAIERDIPFGIYNMTNPGEVFTSQITQLLSEYRLATRPFQFFRNEAEFLRKAAVAPRSNCVLDSSKAIRAGLRLSPVVLALRQSIANWKQPAMISDGHSGTRSGSMTARVFEQQKCGSIHRW